MNVRTYLVIVTGSMVRLSDDRAQHVSSNMAVVEVINSISDITFYQSAVLIITYMMCNIMACRTNEKINPPQRHFIRTT